MSYFNIWRHCGELLDETQQWKRWSYIYYTDVSYENMKTFVCNSSFNFLIRFIYISRPLRHSCYMLSFCFLIFRLGLFIWCLMMILLSWWSGLNWSCSWSSSSITHLSPLEEHCFSRSSAYEWVRIVPLF